MCENIITMGCVEVNIVISPEKIAVACGGMQAKRMQYSLKHIDLVDCWKTYFSIRIDVKLQLTMSKITKSKS